MLGRPRGAGRAPARAARGRLGVSWLRSLGLGFLALVATSVACAGRSESGPGVVSDVAPKAVPSAAERTASGPAEAPMPEADALFERAIAAAGGRAALLAFSGFRANGRFEAAQGVSGRLTILARAPNLVRTSLSLGGGAVVEKGFDGKVAWSKDPSGVVRLASGEEREEILRQADLHRLARYTERYPERRTVGQTVFEGSPAFRVAVKDTHGAEELHFFHRDSGRALGYLGKVPTPSGSVQVAVAYLAWTRVGAIEMPTTLLQRVAVRHEQRITLDKIVPEAPAVRAFTPPRRVALGGPAPR